MQRAKVSFFKLYILIYNIGVKIRRVKNNRIRMIISLCFGDKKIVMLFNSLKFFVGLFTTVKTYSGSKFSKNYKKK